MLWVMMRVFVWEVRKILENSRAFLLE